MRKQFLLFLAIVFTSLTFGQAKGVKIGYIDMEYILQNVPSYTEAKNQLELKAQKWKQEIELKNNEITKLKEALKTAKVDRIMLDNFTPEACIEAIVIIGDQCETEASGGIQMSNLKSYASTGVDFISLGFLTHSYESMDISMKTKLIK